MKIPKELPQFEDETALIVTASKSQAEMYVVQNHELSKVNEIGVGPEYATMQGDMARRGSGRQTGIESAYERGREKMELSFVPTFVEALKNIVAKYNIQSIYMFAPAYQQHYIEPALPKNINSKIKAFVKQNMSRQHPKVLLERLRSFMKKDNVKPMSPEVIKILSRKKMKTDDASENS